MATFSPTSISIDDTSTSITWTDIETTFSFTEYFLFINEIQVATSLGDDTSNINFSSINLFTIIIYTCINIMNFGITIKMRLVQKIVKLFL